VITLDRQVSKHRCEACDLEFAVVCGSAFEDGHPFGSYLVGLHGHSTEGPLVQVAIGLLDRREPEAAPVAIALEASATARELRLTVVDWVQSAWAEETYLGRMLDRVDVVDSPLRPLVLQMADQVLRELPEVQSYFAEVWGTPVRRHRRARG
jgi:hypothetical protein